MPERPTPRDPAERVRLLTRVRSVWSELVREQRLTVLGALILLATLFLPWYDTSVPRGDRFIHESYNGFGSADFTLASVVLVALGVLTLLWARGEDRGFHLPFGDGIVIMVAGGWACLLIFFRVVVHPDLGGEAARVGIQWGVFIAFLAAAFLIYCGYRVHVAHRAEPPLPEDVTGPTIAVDPPTAPTRPRRRGERPRPYIPTEVPPPPLDDDDDPPPPRRARRSEDDDRIPGQMSFDEAETRRLPDR